MKKTIFSIGTLAFSDFVKASLKESTEVKSIKDIKKGQTLMINMEEGAALLIVESVNLETINLIDSMLDTEPKEYSIDDLLSMNPYVLKDTYPSNFVGDQKKELQTYARLINSKMNPSVRVAGIIFPNDSYKTSDKGKQILNEVINYLVERFGVKISSRWSDGCGKVMKMDGAGFNISIENETKNIYTKLFQDGVYHHNHYKMFAFIYNEENDTFEREEAQLEFIQMIEEYANIIPTKTIVDTKLDENANLTSTEQTPIESTEMENEEVLVESIKPKTKNKSKKK